MPGSSGSLASDALDEQLLKHLVIVSYDVENIIIKVNVRTLLWIYVYLKFENINLIIYSTIKIKEIYREQIIIKLPESMIDQPIIEGKVKETC